MLTTTLFQRHVAVEDSLGPGLAKPSPKSVSESRMIGSELRIWVNQSLCDIKKNDKPDKGAYKFNKSGGGKKRAYCHSSRDCSKYALKDSNKKEQHLHSLKEVAPPYNLNNSCFSFRAHRRRFDSPNHRDVEMGRGKLSNTFSKTTRE